MVFLGCWFNPVSPYRNFKVIFEVFSKFCVADWFFCSNMNIKKKADTFLRLFIFRSDDDYLTLRRKNAFFCFFDFFSKQTRGRHHFFLQNKKVWTFPNTNVDMRCHFDIEIGENKFFFRIRSRFENFFSDFLKKINFYIHVRAKKSTAYAKFWKKPQKSP